MEKLDLSKLYKSYFSAKTDPGFVEIGPANFLSITGVGDPSDENFAQDIQALYTTAYAVKFLCKSLGKDFVVSKLEGLWWFDSEAFGHFSMSEAPLKVPRSEWEYRLLIRMPEFVTKEMTVEAIDTAVSKKKIPHDKLIEWYTMTEGKCIQILHVGPFATEPETLQKISDYMNAKNLGKNGLHHEIYLSDFRKTPPEKLRTILREPVK